MFIILLVLFSALGYSIKAETITISGPVWGDWIADTVLVLDDIRVPTGMSLTISPGVYVLFEDSCVFTVDSAALLCAVGSPTDSIIFDAINPETTWLGIKFLSSDDDSELKYCRLSRGGSIDSENCGLVLSHSTISHCTSEGNGGGCYFESSSVIIENCIFEFNQGHRGGAISCYYGDFTIRNNIIRENVTTGYGPDGAGICIDEASGTVSGNIIIDNSGTGYSGDGGGIFCGDQSMVIITSNVISGNWNTSGGGVFIHINAVTATLQTNIIYENTASFGNSGSGGGINCAADNALIEGNYIIQNIGFGDIQGQGGGIFLNSSFTEIIGNVILGNIALHASGGYGGGINCHGGNPTLTNNIICLNFAYNKGGALYCIDYSNPVLLNNTIYRNSGVPDGSAIYGGWFSIPDLNNCILWDHHSVAVSPYNTTINYTDIQGNWTGIGNINEDPMFIDPAHHDYRLQWDSPCIDTGDPDPQYNDPDGTRADMGAFYFDQSVPVRVLLTPHELPYLIEEAGGSMDFTIRLENWDSIQHTVTAWCDATLPDSTIVGPILGPVTLSIDPGVTIERMRTQTIPGYAPFGIYHYNAYVVVDADTLKDSFMFGKLGTSLTGDYNGWGNYGEMIEVDLSGKESHIPNATTLLGVYPNPFNPSTVISYQLAAISQVNLAVYDIAGRKVAELVDGWRTAGVHEVTFDASNLASGVYLYRLDAGDFNATGKMVLMR